MASNLGLGFLSRDRDRRTTRPAGLIYWLSDVPAPVVATGLALQHIAIQSVLFVIAAVLAGSLSPDPADAGRFLSLTILATAAWQALQVLTRGPLGSGYPMPATNTAAFVGAYAIAGLAGMGFGAVGAMLILAGAACALLTLAMHRVRLVLPNEVTGVVVILIGVALVIMGTQRLGMQGAAELPSRTAVLCVFASLAFMLAVALSRTRAAPFSLLIGTVGGALMAIALGQGYPDAAALLAERPWIAFPEPWAPRFDQVSVVPLLAFIIAIVAIKAAALGSMVVMQKASDGNWSRPDSPPIRRGLLANAVGMMAAGAIGAACPGPAQAAVGLSVATGTLARRIVWIGTAILLAAAFCPKLAMLLVLIPEPVKAAMLFYVAGLIMAQGCQLVTARLLDMRRTLIVAFGLSSGIAVAVAPQAFIVAAPVLASPLSIGALVSFVMNLVTLPMVARRNTIPVPLDEHAVKTVTEWVAELAGSWALKQQTATSMEQSLCEFADLLIDRGGTASLQLDARLAEDRVELTMQWAGVPLPNPPSIASPTDVMGSDEERYAFAVWLATRHGQGFRQRAIAGGCEAWIAFED